MDPKPETVSAEEKRRRRRLMPIRAFALGAEPPDDLSDVTTPAERIAMMWPLAMEAWLVSGRALPSYRRSRAPSRLYPPGKPPPEDDGTPGP